MLVVMVTAMCRSNVHLVGPGSRSVLQPCGKISVKGVGVVDKCSAIMPFVLTHGVSAYTAHGQF